MTMFLCEPRHLEIPDSKKRPLYMYLIEFIVHNIAPCLNNYIVVSTIHRD